MKRTELKPVVIIDNKPESGIWFVPSRRIEQVKVKLEKLVRRGRKLGCDPITYTVGESITYCIGHHRCESWGGSLIANGEWEEVLRPYTQVTVAGEAPKFDGWRLVARLLHAGQTGAESTIVNAVPGETVPPQFRTSGCRCDHCKKDWVIRKDTFVVANGDEYKQIGTSCLRDFLGHQSPENIVARFAYFAEGIASCFGGDEDGEDHDEHGLWVRGAIVKGLERVLSVTAAHHRVFGWFSRTAAEKLDRGASVDTVVEVIFGRGTSEDDKKLRAQLTPTEDDIDNAKKSIEWACGIEGRSDFEHNLKAIASSGMASHRTMGLSCAIYGAWRKAFEVEASRKIASETSKHIGTVGERITLHEIKVLSSRCIGEGQYGATWLIKLTNDDGDALTWFTSEEKLQAGETVSLKATVKKHDEFRGVKQTILTRCQEIPTIEQAVRLASLLPAAETLMAIPSRNGGIPEVGDGVPADEYAAAVAQLESEGFIVEDDAENKVWTTDNALQSIMSFAKGRLSKAAKKASRDAKKSTTLEMAVA